jgi:hypothetical protein
MAKLLTASSGASPVFGLIHFSKWLSQLQTVDGAIPLPVLHLVEPANRLLTERNAVYGPNNFVEVLDTIRSARCDYFLGLAFSLGY